MNIIREKFIFFFVVLTLFVGKWKYIFRQLLFLLFSVVYCFLFWFRTDFYRIHTDLVCINLFYSYYTCLYKKEQTPHNILLVHDSCHDRDTKYHLILIVLVYEIFKSKCWVSGLLLPLNKYKLPTEMLLMGHFFFSFSEEGAGHRQHGL